MTKEFLEKTKGTGGCDHRYTFKMENLYQDMNVIFSRKTCEKCGKEIVLSKRSRTRIILFVVMLAILLAVVAMMMKNILPDVSYAAKGLGVVLLFCVIYGGGLYYLMNRAEYVTYVAPERSTRFREAYETARAENDERTRRRYQEAAKKREERKKARSKKDEKTE